jgi:hypothetical protein
MRLNTPPPVKHPVTREDGTMTTEWIQYHQAVYKVLTSPEIAGLNMVGQDLYWRDEAGLNHLLVDVV